MIFVTIGSQIPFDRMIRIVDEVAADFPDVPFIAQVSAAAYQPKHMEAHAFIAPAIFADYIQRADLVISHAGIGTIIDVAQQQKPLIVFPRLGALKETRNDHQVATCNLLQAHGLINVANDADSLRGLIQQFYSKQLKPSSGLPAQSSSQLVHSIRDFILS